MTGRYLEIDTTMSPSSPSSNERPPSAPLGEVFRPLYSTSLKSSVTSIAFWAAVVLPFLHLPLLATGLQSTSLALAFAALVALNVVAVVVGYPHRRD